MEEGLGGFCKKDFQKKVYLAKKIISKNFGRGDNIFGLDVKGAAMKKPRCNTFTMGQLVSIVAAPLNGPRKVEKYNQTPNFCQIGDLFPHTSAKNLWYNIFHFEIFLVFFALWRL